MIYKRIKKPKHLRLKKGIWGGHTTSLQDILPYLDGIGSCVFDHRHFVYDTLDGVFPFPVTCRINHSNQIFLYIEYDL